MVEKEVLHSAVSSAFAVAVEACADDTNERLGLVEHVAHICMGGADAKTYVVVGNEQERNRVEIFGERVFGKGRLVVEVVAEPPPDCRGRNWPEDPGACVVEHLRKHDVVPKSGETVVETPHVSSTVVGRAGFFVVVVLGPVVWVVASRC